VLHAALAFADAHGTDALSMRKLAGELGFEVMSLYNHVTNKDEILDGLVEIVAAEIEAPVGGSDWKASVRASSLSAHQALSGHPWAAGLWATQRSGPVRLAYVEALLRALRESGFSPMMAHYAYHALTLHVLGFASQAQHFPGGTEGLSEAAARFLEHLPAEDYPYMAEHMALHVHATDRVDDFAFILDLLLDGLERARNAERRGRRDKGR
jgi:AcrR family transcriptional regulator